MHDIIPLQNALTNQDFRFCKVDKITTEFLNSLQEKDLFSLHCKDFADFLGFKKADNNFREAFQNLLNKYGLIYIVSRQPLTEWKLETFYNAEKQIYDEMNIKCNSKSLTAPTQRQLYEYIAKESGKTFDEVVKNAIANRRKYCGTIEINEKHQKLSTGFQSGCWLVLYKAVKKQELLR